MTRPQTLAFALTDSPIGLAAWIIKKFRAWSDCGGELESVFTKDELLANISLYWFTGAIGSSFWPYYARMHRPWPVPDHGSITVPTGYCEFPREILRPPKSLAGRTYSDIRRWTVMPRGGHFAAMDQPQSPGRRYPRAFPITSRMMPFFSATHSDALSIVAAVVRRSGQKSIFNLRVDSVEPLLRALGFLPIGCDLRLQLSNPILGRVQLMRKLPSPI